MVIAPIRMTLREFIMLHQDHLSDSEKLFLHDFVHIINVCHNGQKRLTGEDYEEHLYSTYSVLRTLEFPFLLQIGGLGHDLFEDTPITYDNLSGMLNERYLKDPSLDARPLADQIRAVTKYNPPAYYGQMNHSVVTLGIWGTIPLKFSDRYHNLLTVNGFPDIDRRLHFCEETLGPLDGLYHDCRRYIPDEYVPACDELYESVMALAKTKLDENLAARNPTMADLMSASP